MNRFTFIDLFAGIGGFRLAMENQGGQCLFSSEWDKFSQITYKENFGEIPYGDITKINERDIPAHDILCAGFPCQPFSRAGVSARESLNKPHGFECETQGTLFFDIERIVAEKRPKILFLENVPNIVSHDNGQTFRIIRDTIERKLGYSFNYKIMNAVGYVPQQRKRCYMVCHREGKIFQFPEESDKYFPLKDILEDNVDESYTISDRLWAGHQNRTKKNIERGTGFTAFPIDVEQPARTLVARYGKDGKECLIPQKNKNPRKLTERECARLQGYPDWFKIPVSRTQAYRQFGNSVAVPLINIIAQKIIKELL